MTVDATRRIRLFLTDAGPQVERPLVEVLEQSGFDVLLERDAHGVATGPNLDPELALLSIAGTGSAGAELCRRVRSRFSGPLLLLAERGDERDQLAAFDAGVDDFVERPVGAMVLVARLRALLRRTTSPERRPILVGSLVVDDFFRRAMLDGRPLALSPGEFALLHHLAKHLGSTVRRAELHSLLGVPIRGRDRAIDLRVSRLRAKLSGGPVRLRAVRNEGYVLLPSAGEGEQRSPRFVSQIDTFES